MTRRQGGIQGFPAFPISGTWAKSCRISLGTAVKSQNTLHRKENKMDLLTKFSAVEIKPETRISEADRAFCQAHQTAYEAASNVLKELEYFWDDMQAGQQEALSPINLPPSLYLTSPNHLTLSTDAIRGQLRSLHALFISQLVSYFNRTYHLAIPAEDIQKNLTPQKPSDRWADNRKEQMEEYNKALEELSLHYSEILEHVFLLTDSRELTEQALYELKEKCHKAAWNSSNGQAMYLLKKNVLQLDGYACRYRDWYGGRSSWELSDRTADILKAVAHFEAEGFTDIPNSLNSVIQRGSLDDSQYEFTGCRKVQSLKLFKNNRMDIRFHTENDARAFTEEYLGTTPPC